MAWALPASSAIWESAGSGSVNVELECQGRALQYTVCNLSVPIDLQGDGQAHPM